MTIRKILLLAATFAPMAASADIGWYVGAGAGGTRLEEDLNLTFTASEYDANGVLTPIVSRPLDKFSGTDLGFRVFGGVRFGRFFGIEAGYVDLGETEDDVALTVPGNSLRPITDVGLKLTDAIEGWEIFALGAFPLSERWEAFAKLGVLNWDSDFVARNAFADVFPPSPPNTPQFIPTVTPASFSASDDGTDLAGGLGFNYQATEHMALRGEGTWYDIDNTERAWMLGFSVIVNY